MRVAKMDIASMGGEQDVPSTGQAGGELAMKPDQDTAALVSEVARRRLNRREIMRWGAGLGLSAPVIAGLLANMPKASAQEGGAVAKGPQVDKLVFWTRSTPDAPGNTEWANLTNVAKAYTDAVGTEIEMVTVPDADFRSRLSISAPAGEGPDVMGPIAHDWIGEVALQEIALEVPDSVVTDKADILPASLALSSYEGKLFGLPLFAESVALVYNKDMVPEAPTTWDDLVAMATELTAGDVYGFGFPIMEDYHIGGFFMGFGSYIFKYADGAFNTEDIGLNNEGGVAAAKFLRDVYNQKMPPLPEVAIDRTNMHGVQEGMMEAGQLGMTINGPWREAPLTKAGINYGVAKLPSLPNGNPMKPFLGVQAMVASAYSEKQEASLDFINFVTQTASVGELFKAFIKLPVRTTALETDEVKANPNMAIWGEQALDAEPMPNIAAMSNVWTPWSDAMDGIIPENAADDQVKTLLDGAVDNIKQAIADTE
jgi:arabinogalactan oligomer/maltooligosaccharide transport system substrate-binding protein